MRADEDFRKEAQGAKVVSSNLTPSYNFSMTETCPRYLPFILQCPHPTLPSALRVILINSRHLAPPFIQANQRCYVVQH